MNPWLQSMLNKSPPEPPPVVETPTAFMDHSKLARAEGESEESHLSRVQAWMKAQAQPVKPAKPAKSSPSLTKAFVDLSAHFEEQKKDVVQEPTANVDTLFPPDVEGDLPDLIIEKGNRAITVRNFDPPVPEPDAPMEPEVRELDHTYDIDVFKDQNTDTIIPGVDAIITRMGGKNQLVNHLVTLFPKCHTYVEVFGGTFQVLLRKPWVDKVEIINDVDQDIVYLYQYIRAKPRALCDYVNSLPISEALILGMRKSLAKKELRGIQRAAATLLSIRTSFNGMVSESRYKSNPFQRIQIRLDLRHLMMIKQRLDPVDIRSRDFRSVITLANKDLPPEKYPPGRVFFYLDPPYWQTAGYTGHGGALSFGWQEQCDLADLCWQIHQAQNKFIQTNSGHEDLRRLYGRYKNPDGSPAFYIDEVDVKYTVSGNTESRKETKEFIISNWPLQKQRGQGKLFS